MDAQSVTRTSNNLVDVCIVRRISRQLRIRIAQFSAKRFRGAFEIRPTARNFTLLKCIRNSYFLVCLDAWRPKHVIDMDCGKWNGLERIIALRAARSAFRLGRLTGEGCHTRNGEYYSRYCTESKDFQVRHS